MTGRFFQIDRRSWCKACDVGLNAAVAYLVLATGTGGDNRTTSWSVNSVRNYPDIGLGRSNAAIDQLKSQGLIKQKKAGSRPSYQLVIDDKKTADWIWLPNTLVTGAVSEVPPIERIRRRGDVRALRLFVELYHEHSLADDGGLHWKLIRRNYECQKVGEAGHGVFWDFSDAGVTISWRPPFDQFLTGRRTKDGGDQGGDAAWAALNAIVECGLVECVPHLIEADTEEAEIIHPCPENTGTDIEQKLGMVVRKFTMELAGSATLRMIGDGDDIIAVNNQYPNVQMVGIYRLRYRPHTKATAAWFAQSSKWQEFIEGYEAMIHPAEAGQPVRMNA